MLSDKQRVEHTLRGGSNERIHVSWNWQQSLHGYLELVWICNDTVVGSTEVHQTVRATLQTRQRGGGKRHAVLVSPIVYQVITVWCPQVCYVVKPVSVVRLHNTEHNCCTLPPVDSSVASIEATEAATSAVFHSSCPDKVDWVKQGTANNTKLPREATLNTWNAWKPLGGRGSARTLLSKLTALPGPRSWWGEDWQPPPK